MVPAYFTHIGFHWLILHKLHCVLRQMVYLQNVLYFGTFPQTLDLEKFRRGSSAVADCHKQATIVDLLLTWRRTTWLSAVNSRPTTVTC